MCEGLPNIGAKRAAFSLDLVGRHGASPPTELRRAAIIVDAPSRRPLPSSARSWLAQATFRLGEEWAAQAPIGNGNGRAS